MITEEDLKQNPKMAKLVAQADAKQTKKRISLFDEVLGKSLVEDLMKPSQNKYHVAEKNDRTYNGIVFDSKHEMNEWINAELLERAGEIDDLQRQVHFNLMQGFIHPQYGRINPIAYVADIVYRDLKGEYAGKMVVKDAKGVRTTEYQIKRKLFLKMYPEYIFLEV